MESVFKIYHTLGGSGMEEDSLTGSQMHVFWGGIVITTLHHQAIQLHTSFSVGRGEPPEGETGRLIWGSKRSFAFC